MVMYSEKMGMAVITCDIVKYCQQQSYRVDPDAI